MQPNYPPVVPGIITWEPGQQLPDSFLQLPHLLYRHDPLWIPESEAETAAAFSEKNSYFQENTAKVWVVPGQARLAAFFDPGLDIEGQKAAFFGFWETTDSEVPNQELFGLAEEWARQQGAKTLYGPINFNTYHKYRIRLNLQPGEGCFLGEPYNPQYYRLLLENCGYRLHTVYLSQYVPESLVEHIYLDKEQVLEQMRQLPFRVQYLTPGYWLSRLPEFYEVAQDIFSQNFAYAPVTFEQFSQVYGRAFASRFCPNLSTVVLDESNRILAFSIGYPDYSPLCRQGAEQPVQVSELSYEKHYPLLQKPTYLMRTLGVHPDYRQRDIMTAIGAYTGFRFRDFYQTTMACTMRADNFSTRFFGPYDVQRREYGLFSKALF